MKPITELRVRTVANGIEVFRSSVTWQRRDGSIYAPDSDVFVFQTVEQFVEWAREQTWAFASDVEKA